MEEVKTNSGQNLGIAALITGIITFVIAVIPCVGMIAIIPGIITIILASVGLSQASRNNSPRGVIVAGLVIGILAFLISASQWVIAGRMLSKADKWPDDFKSMVEEIKKDVMDEVDKGNIDIRIESKDGDTVVIKSNPVKENREKTLEDLESVKKAAVDSVKKAK
jgi:hypothetical protein